MYDEKRKQRLRYIIQLIILTVRCLLLLSNAATWHINIESAVTGAFIYITKACPIRNKSQIDIDISCICLLLIRVCFLLYFFFSFSKPNC